MLKSIAPWAIIAVILIAGAYYIGWNKNKDEIERVKAERTAMQIQRDSINAFVEVKKAEQKLLEERISILSVDAQNLREHVNELEELRKHEQLAVRRIKTPADLVDKFSTTFPELPKDKIVVFEEYVREFDIKLEYLGVPLWFNETFIIDHQNSLSYLAQKDKLWEVDSLNRVVIDLDKQVLKLERDVSSAYKTGYDSAFVKYMDISKLYIDELKKPQFGLPQWGAIVGAAAAGYFAGNAGN